MRFISLRMKLIAALLVLILIPILGVGVYAYHEFEQTLSQQIESVTSDRLNQVNRNIELDLKMMVNASSSIVLDENVRMALSKPSFTDKEKLNHVYQMDKKFLEISTAIITDPVFITIFDKYGSMYTNWSQRPDSYDRIYGSEWFQKALHQNGYMVWEIKDNSYIYPYADKMVTLAMLIKDNSLTNDLGMLVISEPEEHYLDILKVKDAFLGNLGFIVGEQGEFLAEDDKLIQSIYPSIVTGLATGSGAFTSKINGEPSKVITNWIALTDWRVVQIVPNKEIFKKITETRNVVSIILLISMTIFIVLIIFISSMITSSLRKLGFNMKQIESGNLDVSFDFHTRDEVGLLARSFNQMLKKLRHHIENEIILERSKEKAKLEALQAQINPHFLHNTLNTIKWMSIMAGTKNITEMLLSLGHLLNMSIHRGQEVITLAEEMDNVRYFLTIQKYRFGDTILITEDIDPETLMGLVPKLSLQPLVENVYRHGLFINGGEMIIRSRRDGDDLYLEVIDNGTGPSEDRIKEMQDHLTVEESGFSGIGIKNVHKRIQMMFGSEYGLKIDRNDKSGTTCISIKLPFRRDWNEYTLGSD